MLLYLWFLDQFIPRVGTPCGLSRGIQSSRKIKFFISPTFYIYLLIFSPFVCSILTGLLSFMVGSLLILEGISSSFYHLCSHLNLMHSPKLWYLHPGATCLPLCFRWTIALPLAVSQVQKKRKRGLQVLLWLSIVKSKSYLTQWLHFLVS